MDADPRTTLVPLPRSVESREGSFEFGPSTAIVAAAAHHDVAELVAADLEAVVGRRPAVVLSAAGAHVELIVHDGRADLGSEGYELLAGDDRIGIVAATEHGLWNGSRTLLQLIPPDTARVPAVHVVDGPRFEWRGAMLDVARHFFTVAEVRRFIDLLARFKLDRLHLHLSDDQGWRLEIPGWPALTQVGGSTATGGDPGGWYSIADWNEIVRYAEQRFVTVVPEIDMPGHTNAALASVAGLNPDGVAPPLYTGTEVGFSSLRLDVPLTRRFVADVIAAMAASTPGPYVHIGGDEAHSTEHAAYVEFVELLQAEVARHGKHMVGWEEITAAPLLATTLVQHWLKADTAARAPATSRFVMSPSARTYFDMKHAPDDRLGRRWAGAIDAATAYDWDPTAILPGVDEARIAGVEAPLWTEKVRTFDDALTLTFPRLACLAEVGWTAQAARTWDHFAPRLAAVTRRLVADGVPCYESVVPSGS